MRLKENYKVRKIGGEYMMVSEDGSGLDYTRVISLNASAAYLIEETGQKEFTRLDWVKLLIARYSISPERAEEDVNALVDKLIKENIADE